VVQAIDANLPGSAAKVLEVGVGAGIFTRYLSERSCQVLAIDINPAFLRAVNHLPGVDTREADLATLEVSGFDLALCSEVLEHLRPDTSQRALDGLFTALRPGGVLVLTTPQSYSTMELFARMLGHPLALALARKLYGTVDELGHTNRLTRGVLLRQVEKAGFQVVSQHLSGLYLPIVAEAGGQTGQKLAAMLADRLSHVPVLSGSLWHQCYVLRRPKS
jgi:2-polyprenyl-3-methyl-5-hydroxy-6-metoxy-1,4-benzoquinol methylase